MAIVCVQFRQVAASSLMATAGYRHWKKSPMNTGKMADERFPKAITEQVELLPDGPGVYLMKDTRGAVIYIGKAKTLRQRVRSYFQLSRSDLRPQIDALVTHVASFEYMVTSTETEALVLEANLVREHKPRYNINLKDDKKYPYIKITNEPYPRVLVTRNFEKDGGTYFGPYTSVKALRRTLKTVHRVFPLRTCKHVLPAAAPKRPCLNYQIKRCAGVCQGYVTENEYARIVNQARLFLAGRSDELIKTLEARMREAAAEQKFESAAQYRDRLEDIQKIASRQQVMLPSLEDRDVIALAREDNDACGVILEIRSGKLMDRKEYFLGGVIHASDEEIMEALVKQFYVGATIVPKEIHLMCHMADEQAIVELLQQMRGRPVALKVPQRGDKARLVELAAKNAQVLLTERKLKRERLKEEAPHVVQALQRDLHLKRPPRQIEAVDISDIHGTDAVGSLVSFWDGEPKKSQYRRFKIHTVGGADDFAMMREVVHRRFSRLMKEERELPDLLLVDGGKGQLFSALEALSQLGIAEQPVAGLAKRLEEVYVPGCPDPQNIPKTSSSLKLLQAIRDEAHRFAITYHRKLRSKRTIASELDRIPGVGEARKARLLQSFGSVAQIAKAHPKAIAQAAHITEQLAQSIKKHLENRTTSK